VEEIMARFEAIVPESVAGCIEVLAERGAETAILAGGTDLFVLMKMGMKTPGVVLHTGHLQELRGAERRDGRMMLGPGVTHSDLSSLDLLEGLETLKEAAASVGSPQVRNLGTLGGNIVNASPAGDLYPALLALDATVTLKGANGEREVTLEDFVTGPGETVIEPDELLVATSFELPPVETFTGFAKVGLRNALAISVANAAMVAGVEDGKLKDVRVACGAVAPTPIRMRGVEGLLEGQEPTDELIAEASRLASSECDPLTDIRATREYRCHVTGVVVARMIRKARIKLLGNHHD
jgi:CO/xanthine dehydrogenase FAD-binding subunit